MERNLLFVSGDFRPNLSIVSRLDVAVKAKKISSLYADYEIYEGPDSTIKESKLYKAINLARLGMKEYYSIGCSDEDEDMAECKKFISKYIDKDISKMKIPAVKYE